MKHTIKTLLTICLCAVVGSTFGQVSSLVKQVVPSQVVENISTESAVQVVEAACLELGYKPKQFDRKNKVIITAFFEWTTVAIGNRGQLKFECADNNVKISVINRQYNSSEGWTESSTKFSKKNIKKYIASTAEKVAAIEANKELVANSVINSMLIRSFNPVVHENDMCRIELVKCHTNVKTPTGNIPCMMQINCINKSSQDGMRFSAYTNGIKMNGEFLKTGLSGARKSAYRMPYQQGDAQLTSADKSSPDIEAGGTITLFLYFTHEDTDWSMESLDEVKLPAKCFLNNRSLLEGQETVILYSLPTHYGEPFIYE